MWNNNKCQCESKKHNICVKYYIWNAATDTDAAVVKMASM